jgi:hypothetical protein
MSGYFVTSPDPFWVLSGHTLSMADPADWLLLDCSGILFDCPIIQSPGNPSWDMGTGPVTMAGAFEQGAPGASDYASTGSMRVGTTWSLIGSVVGPADREIIRWNGGLVLGGLSSWTAIQGAEGGGGISIGTGAGTYFEANVYLYLHRGIVEDTTNVDGTPYVVLNVDRECAIKTDVARTVNLQALADAGDGRVLIVSDRIGTAPANPITINPNGAEKINGVAAAVTIDWAWGSLWLKADVSEGTWRIIGGW